MTPESEAITAKVIASSIDPHGSRIDTLQLRYPRMVHADFMTHRVFSRNASSSRAKPSFLLRNELPYVPRFKKNKAGMQPAAFLSDAEQRDAEAIWIKAMDACREASALLSAPKGLNVHKQWTNRMLEWFGYIDVLVTSTTWINFDILRRHTDAQEEIQMLAAAIKTARDNAIIRPLSFGQWHLPYITEQDRLHVEVLCRRELPDDARAVIVFLKTAHMGGIYGASDATLLLLAMSAARCCRVSYSKHDGTSPELHDDLKLFHQLAISKPLHASPLEHQAMGLCMLEDHHFRGNFEGFSQFRKYLPGEAAKESRR